MTVTVLIVALISYVAFLLIERYHLRFMADHYKREADYRRGLVIGDSGSDDDDVLRAIAREAVAAARSRGYAATHRPQSGLFNDH